MISSSHWGVLIARHNCVQHVEKDLRSMEIDHLVPSEEKIVVVSGRRVLTRSLLLGNYVLLSICSQWRRVAGLKSVSGMLLNTLGFPAQVVPKELEQLREACAHRSTVLKEGFQYGERVAPRTGPLVHMTGRYEGTKGRNDVAIFRLFGREQKVEFRRGELIAMETVHPYSVKASKLPDHQAA